MKLTHVVQFSGGIGSFAAAEKVVAEYGKSATTLLFADTMTEDEDTYRFLYQAAEYLGCKLEVIADGRNVWEIFAYKRFLGNSRVDPCSRILKRELCKNWIEANFTPENCRLYVGIDWTEAHRMKNVLNWWSPFAVYAPLVGDMTYDKEKAIQRLHEAGIPRQRLYTLGFPHANCGGFCVKAGKAHFLHLLDKMPAVFAYHERKEQEFQAFIGKPYTVLRENKVYKDAVIGWGVFEASRERGSKIYRWLPETKRYVEIEDPTVEKVVYEDKVRIQSYLSLRELRERREYHLQTEEGQEDWGGCACATDMDEEEIAEERARVAKKYGR